MKLSIVLATLLVTLVTALPADRAAFDNVNKRKRDYEWSSIGQPGDDANEKRNLKYDWSSVDKPGVGARDLKYDWSSVGGPGGDTDKRNLKYA